MFACVSVFVYASCVSGAHRDQKKALDPLKLLSSGKLPVSQSPRRAVSTWDELMGGNQPRSTRPVGLVSLSGHSKTAKTNQPETT